MWLTILVLLLMAVDPSTDHSCSLLLAVLIDVCDLKQLRWFVLSFFFAISLLYVGAVVQRLL